MYTLLRKEISSFLSSLIGYTVITVSSTHLDVYKRQVLVLAYRNYLANGNVAVSYSNNYPSLVPDFQVIDTDELPGCCLLYTSRCV